MQTVEKWKKYELTLNGPSDGNPFRDVELTATFDRNNHQITVDGFYDGMVFTSCVICLKLKENIVLPLIQMFLN